MAIEQFTNLNVHMAHVDMMKISSTKIEINMNYGNKILSNNIQKARNGAWNEAKQASTSVTASARVKPYLKCQLGS